jgi:clan AA aspartic protease (TIGR02281 family)
MTGAMGEGGGLVTAACHAHASVPALTTCRGCFRPLCELCAINDSHLVPRCAECTRRRSRRSAFASGALAVLLVTAMVAAVKYHQHSKREREALEAAKAATPDYGIQGELITKLNARMAREPCDRDGIVELGEALMRAGDARTTIKRSSAFISKCGEHPRLRWLTYAAHKQLSEWDGAVTEATKLIEFDPYDADYRGWRGLMYERKGDLARAVEDYQQALVLRPRMADLRLNLADALEKLGRPCEAILPLAQGTFYYPNATNVESLHARVEHLSSSAHCAWAAGVGEAQIKVKPGSHVMMVEARVNNREVGEFVVDTGATLVVLSRDFANRLGIRTGGAPTILTETANGVTRGAVVSLNEIEVQGIRAARVVAVVVERLADDGLLGMSFLSRFDLAQKGGVFEIRARAPR